MASNWFSLSTTTFNVPIWSVSAEILVYAAFFVIVRTVRPGLLMCGVIVLLAKLVNHGIPSLECMEFFFAGGLVQRLLSRIDAKHYGVAFWCAVCIAAAVIVRERWGFAINGTPLIFLSTSLVAAFALIGNLIKWDMMRLSRLGDLTYASYLVHFPFQLALVLGVDALDIDRAIFLSPSMFLFFLFGTFGISTFVNHYFEHPMQNMIRSHWTTRMLEVSAAQQLGTVQPTVRGSQRELTKTTVTR
jgi:peptidoglycan/LPS O-acetylase OafA/YrhL